MNVEIIAGRIPRSTVGMSAPMIYSYLRSGSLQVQYGVKYWAMKPKEIDFQCFFGKNRPKQTMDKFMDDNQKKKHKEKQKRSYAMKVDR